MDEKRTNGFDKAEVGSLWYYTPTNIPKHLSPFTLRDPAISIFDGTNRASLIKPETPIVKLVKKAQIQETFINKDGVIFRYDNRPDILRYKVLAITTNGDTMIGWINAPSADRFFPYHEKE